MGVLGFANFVQTFYYSGTLPLSNMPEVGLWAGDAGWRASKVVWSALLRAHACSSNYPPASLPATLQN